MANRPPVRDYLYVSTRELERLAADLPENSRERMTALIVKAAALGVGMSLADAPEETVLGVLAEVESTLRDEQPVRHVADTDLAIGQWFESGSVQMAYGVQAARRSEDSNTAVFVGPIDDSPVRAESSLLLGGHAEYLEKRRATTVQDVSGGMSYPSALFALLASLYDRKVADRSPGADAEPPRADRRVPSHRGRAPGEGPREEQWLAVGYPIAQAQSSFGQRGYFPLSFLARAVKIVEFESRGLPGRWIVGRPLWIAEQVLV